MLPVSQDSLTDTRGDLGDPLAARGRAPSRADVKSHTGVVPGGPAATNGVIKEGDKLITIDGMIFRTAMLALNDLWFL